MLLYYNYDYYIYTITTTTISLYNRYNYLKVVNRGAPARLVHYGPNPRGLTRTRPEYASLWRRKERAGVYVGRLVLVPDTSNYLWTPRRCIFQEA